MWSKTFWKDTAERAIRTGAQTAIALYAGLQVADVNSWTTFAVGVVGAVVLSVLTSLVASQRGDPADASLITSGGDNA